MLLERKRRKGHNYERMCLGCGRLRHKRDLIRISALRDGSIIIDEWQSHSGRGAYVCPISDCTIAMVKKRSLSHGLKRPIDPRQVNELLSQLKRHILWMSGDLTRLW